MEATAARRAAAAAISVARSCGLVVDDAVVLNDSNRLVVRLTPCDVVARIVPRGYRVFASAVGAAREVEVLRRLVHVGAPVAGLDPRVEARAFVQDDFEIELLTYHEPVTTTGQREHAAYATALERLHGALRAVDVDAPHFTERVADVQSWVARRAATPDLSDEDRALLGDTLTDLREAVVARRRPEQLLHGEPHPWNVLDTERGLLFVDLENCVRGPVEWDLGWVPAEVSARCAAADPEVVEACRGLVLTLVAAHAWRPEDERPGAESRAAFMDAVRAGPPWTALDAV